MIFQLYWKGSIDLVKEEDKAKIQFSGNNKWVDLQERLRKELP